jgi:hypothetical protein
MFENTCEIEIQFRLHGRIPPVDAIDVWKVPNTQFVLIHNLISDVNLVSRATRTYVQ